jgi:hypothetical protein
MTAAILGSRFVRQNTPWHFNLLRIPGMPYFLDNYQTISGAAKSIIWLKSKANCQEGQNQLNTSSDLFGDNENIKDLSDLRLVKQLDQLDDEFR